MCVGGRESDCRAQSLPWPPGGDTCWDGGLRLLGGATVLELSRSWGCPAGLQTGVGLSPDSRPGIVGGCGHTCGP